MLRSFLSLSVIFSLAITSVNASNLVAPIGVVDGVVTVEAAPTSTLIVTLDVVTEDVTVGVYARYAQKLLGVRASLVAKSTTTITSADIALAAEDYYIYRGCCDKKEVVSEIPTLPIDASASGILPAEQAAEQAAKEIFKIRRIRREMISGDLGEGFFGGGLSAALERLDFEEQSYLELFMGRTTTTRESRSFDVAINSGVTRYIVCRYSPQLGLVDSSDLTAEPILLQVTPSEEKLVSLPSTGDKPARRFRVANRSTCELFYGSKVLDSSVIPLFEFGNDVSSLLK